MRSAASKISKDSIPTFPVSYSRGPVDSAKLAKEGLCFQLLECDQIKGSPSRLTAQALSGYQEVPVVRIYGTTNEGNSVLVHSYNFEPYLWMEAPSGWIPQYAQSFQQTLNQALAGSTRLDNTIVRIDTHQKMSLKDYRGGVKTDFLRVVVQMPQHVPKVRGLLGQGVSCDLIWDGLRCFQTYESNIIFPLRYLVDNNIGGSNWITIPAGQFRTVDNRSSRCQIEVECDFAAITSHEPLGEYMSIAPYRILSIDIECQGRKGFFPEPEHDPVIQIANQLVTYGTEQPVAKCIFTLKGCASIAGADVYSFNTEEELLCAWVAFVQFTDPDILTGYNITGFDFPYLINRSKALKIEDKFCYWSRQMFTKTQAKPRTFMSKQMGNRESFDVEVDGRVVMDVMVAIQRDYKLRSYSLNAVSQHFLGEQKEDVHHSIIGDLQNGDDETRRRLAVYCLKDAYLPVRLIQKLMILVNNVEMARVTGVPIGWLLERGQQIKVFSQMLRKALDRDLLFPTEEQRGGLSSAIGYEGATVLDPIRGFYETPVATLDFASLYPSIMMAHNLCYSTIIRPSDWNKYDPADVTITPAGHRFIKQDKFAGILPEILQELLSARKRAKNMMKDAKDPLEYAVLNGRQLALKISANSVYGFTGAQNGKLPCLEISASVTSFGRIMIHKTRDVVQEKYPGTKVVYGDTDSVMILCDTDKSLPDKEQIEAAMAFGDVVAKEISKDYPYPINMCCTGAYLPCMINNTHRRGGLWWSRDLQQQKVVAKGFGSSSATGCPLLNHVISGVLNRILIQRSVESAKEFVIGTITDLLMNRLDITQLIFLRKWTDESNVRLRNLAQRTNQRNAAAINYGDQIAYVVVKSRIEEEIFEDPVRVIEQSIPVDAQYYLEQQLKAPILRVFEGVLDDPSVLVKGAHTRHIVIVAPSASAGGLMKFVKVQQQCLACRRAMPGETGAVCKNCTDKEADTYGRIMAKRNHYEAIYSKVWTQCQQCQGSLEQEVLCTSKDCPVFYMRKKVQKDLAEQQNLLDRFGPTLF